MAASLPSGEVKLLAKFGKKVLPINIESAESYALAHRDVRLQMLLRLLEQETICSQPAFAGNVFNNPAFAGNVFNNPDLKLGNVLVFLGSVDLMREALGTCSSDEKYAIAWGVSIFSPKKCLADFALLFSIPGTETSECWSYHKVFKSVLQRYPVSIRTRLEMISLLISTQYPDNISVPFSVHTPDDIVRRIVITLYNNYNGLATLMYSLIQSHPTWAEHLFYADYSITDQMHLEQARVLLQVGARLDSTLIESYALNVIERFEDLRLKFSLKYLPALIELGPCYTYFSQLSLPSLHMRQPYIDAIEAGLALHKTRRTRFIAQFKRISHCFCNDLILIIVNYIPVILFDDDCL